MPGDTATVEKTGAPERFPIQTERGAAAHPLSIPWSLAEEAYSAYAAKWGKSQSLERLAERGGLCPSEMDEFRPGWREAASENAALRAEVERLTKERDAALKEAGRIMRIIRKRLSNIARRVKRAANASTFIAKPRVSCDRNDEMREEEGNAK